MKVQLCSLLLLFIFAGTLNGFPTGAPLLSCDNLLPQHNFSSRPLSNNTFRLFFGNVMSYNPGQNLEIILEGNLSFRYFIRYSPLDTLCEFILERKIHIFQNMDFRIFTNSRRSSIKCCFVTIKLLTYV